MRTHHAHPDPRVGMNLVFEPTCFEQAALAAAYQHVVPRVRRATAWVTPAAPADKTRRDFRRESA